MIPRTLIDTIKENRCLPVIGAGFSLNAELPNGKTMPTWPQLTTILAEKIKTKENDPLLVFQEFQEKSDRTTLIRTIENSLYKDEAKPGHVHRHLVKIPYFDIICTTNYDDLLESACKQEGIPVKTIVEKQQISLHGSAKELKIFKMHGDLDHTNELVITKQDYEKYQEKKQEFVLFLSSLLMTKTPLFLGFSLKDSNFQQIKKMIDSLMGEAVRKGYIVLFDPEKQDIIDYQNLNLQVISIDTNGRSKSECLLDFIKEIHQPSPTKIPSTLTVSTNRTVLFKNQKLEIRTVTDDSLTSAISIIIKKENGDVVFKGDMSDSKKISKGLLEKEIILTGVEWEAEQDYTVFAEYEGQKVSDSFTLLNSSQIVAQTDKSVYIYGSDIILTVIAPQAHIGSFIDYQIMTSGNVLVKEGKIPIDSETTGIFQKSITIEGEHWKEKGAEFEIIVQYGDEEASVTIFTSNFGASIELDQRVYSWTDKVRITIVAPDFNTNSNKVDYIGSDENGLVSIHTSKGSIGKYRLEETGPDTGIFIGEIELTGFPGFGVRENHVRKSPFGITRGKGPYDGMLTCLDEDVITVLFKYSSKEVPSASAIIRWNIGEIQFLEPVYTLDDYATIRVVDPDMNLDPNEKDSFKIRVWSDSDQEGITIPVYETHAETGIFEGVISFDQKHSSNNGKLKVTEGDIISAEYLDFTLPDPYTQNDSLTIIGTAKILSHKKHYFPLEQLKIDDVLITNLVPSKGEKILEKETAKINVNISNKNETRSSVLVLAQIRDEHDAVVYLICNPLSVNKSDTATTTFIWRPDFSGKYNISIYVWSSIDNREALCDPVTREIEIIPKE